VLVYVAEKGIDVDLVDIDMMAGEHRQPAFLALNPAGTVPVLEVGPGALVRQSTAIMEYLEEVHPEPNLIGRTPLERARTRDLMSMINDCYLYHLNFLAQKSPAFSAMLEQTEEAASAFHARYRRAITEIEQIVDDGDFMTGHGVTIADCMMFASAQYTDLVYREPLPDDCPKLKAHHERFSRRPSASVPEYPEAFRRRAPFRTAAG
jgi:glutathione S-transferase